MKHFELSPIATQVTESVSNELEQAKARLAETDAMVSELQAKLRLRERLREASRELQQPLREPAVSTEGTKRGRDSSGDAPGFEFNAARDTELANDDPRFSSVVHVFHKEWFGMRAAAGALPGHKLAVPAGSTLSGQQLVDVAGLLSSAGVEHVVVHGFSDGMAKLVRSLRAAGFDNIGLVWHGAAGMWIHEEERKLFFGARDLLRGGVFRRMHGMRPGTELLIGENAFSPQLLNMPPVYAPKYAGRTDGPRTAFAPSWNLVHKNLMSNVMAAIHNPAIGRIVVMAKGLALPAEESAKLSVLGHLTQKEALATMDMSDLVMNVSLVDCHPMVEMEALAARTPCLRGQLHLDVLEDHEYAKLTTVRDPLNISEISSRITRVLEQDPAQIRESMHDYAVQLRTAAAERYLQFISN